MSVHTHTVVSRDYVYEGHYKFRFNTLDIDDVGAQEMFWFDKD